jgi:DNA repair exonuclease SbcCD ATPase subunit
MIHISNAFNVKFMMFKWVPGFLFVLTLALFSAGCSKEPAASEQADKNTNAGNANQQDQSAAATPYMQPTLRGDIERASLAISMARDAVKLNKWQDAVSQLQGARKEVDAALSRQPRLREELEALKSAINRAIPAIEGRGKEAEARVAELQTRIGAIKVNTLAQ